MTANRRYQVAVEDLRLGMFVVELDRPWLDTPFLLQGFLVDSQVELDTLVKYCDYVYVDLELSSPDVADLIRRVEIRAAALEPQTRPMAERTLVVNAMQAKLDGTSALSNADDNRRPQPGAAPVTDLRAGRSTSRNGRGSSAGASRRRAAGSK